MKNTNLCPDCGAEMEMYYTLQCFHCKKPNPDERGRGNLLMARNWLRHNEPDWNDNEDNWWSYLCNHQYITHNDSWIELQEDMGNKGMQLFTKHFPVEGILWEVSW